MTEIGFQTFVRDTLSRIEKRIESFEKTCYSHGDRILTLEINQKSLLNGRKDAKIFWIRVGAAILGATILTALGVIFGKSL